ncbi:hypothetical protein HQ865_00445 [Mucilaginibacter mali]|uniref:Uncharacterized protein n=1 Tax=Mucilaginibacter mali TaxID=2740462 RepID=A0A7D4PRK2_9SPHI|nr:hypothetical protein [Mucilaginibacter mali]QKJ28288.1 hypothetical protein HQ865_00445 [Mucilaginibacter mali]
MIEAIKTFFVKSHGILLIHKHDLPYEFNDYYDEIVSDLEMKGIREDKKNMKSDGGYFKNDIKKSIAAYHSELANG